jgi:signal transduction histidine kinase
MGVWAYYELKEDQLLGVAELNEGTEEAEGFNDALHIVLVCGIPAALIGIGGGWFLMRKALAPVKALTAAAARVNERNLREQLPRTGNGDELDQLTDVFNSMTARLDASFQQIREFTLHASHELKTPLTVMRGEIETQLADNKTTEAERERLLSQLDELERLTKIVDGLTLLTKADAGQIELKKEPVRLDELVRDAAADAEILAQPKQIKVVLARCDAATVTGDRHRLRQLLLNLTDNAVKYNCLNGELTLSLRTLDGISELRVTNTGQGIPPAMLPRVFDRFFRVDQSHNSAVDGCGLGLSIVKWIADAHGATIAVTSEAERLTEFVLRFPIK